MRFKKEVKKDEKQELVQNKDKISMLEKKWIYVFDILGPVL